MQAVIRTGGKQYYVAPGDILEVDKVAGEIGETITLSDILMVAGDEEVTIGQPTVSDAAVIAKITGQYRGNKVRVFRYRPKKRIRVRRGHRQYLTRLEIQSITWGDQEFTVPAVEEPVVAEAAVEEVVAEEVAAVAAVEESIEEAIGAEATEESVGEAQDDAIVEAQDAGDADEVDAEDAGEDDAGADHADGKKE
ncbi:MAG: 50S ribosomal protein L21 [Hyphomicrobiales bacterium]|nr:50S ribosomal protein L21 [Hyphomicrobiales bacterium]